MYTYTFMYVRTRVNLLACGVKNGYSSVWKEVYTYMFMYMYMCVCMCSVKLYSHVYAL